MGVSATLARLELFPGLGSEPPRLQPVAPVGLRWLAVHLPAFRLERCGWQADDLAVVTALRQNATRVVALTPAARAEGLAEGCVLAEARALVPGLHVEPLDEVAEAADRRELARAFEVFGDRVEVDGDDGLLLEVSTTSPLFRGELEMLAKVHARAEELGHRCRLAVADHPRAARALARHGAGDVVAPAGEGAAALAGLPIGALEPSEALAEALVALGIRTVGAWAKLEAASVAGRFGSEGVELHRVARGRAAVAWVDRPTPPPIAPVRLLLDHEAADVEAVLVSVAEGLARLRDRLAARDLVVARLDLRCELAWGRADDAEQLSVRVARPTRDPELLLRLLRGALGLRLGKLPAPVVAVELHAAEVAPDGGGQQDLLARREGHGAWSELLARLGDVLGDQAVVAPSLVEGWRPEEAWEARPANGPPPGARVDPRIGSGPHDDPVERLERAAWTAPRPRPTLLRHPPLPLRVREEQGRPVAVHARQGWRPIRRARGPERLSGGWWRPDGGFDRTYWVAQLPEGTAWLFTERGQWFLHGWFD